MRDLGIPVVMVGSREERADAGGRSEPVGARWVTGDPSRPDVLEAAGIATARALVLTGSDDLSNLHIALAAQEIRPGVPTVLRMFDEELGRRVGERLAGCTALSASAIAAPSFVSAALREEGSQPLSIAGRRLRLVENPGEDDDVVRRLGPGRPVLVDSPDQAHAALRLRHRSRLSVVRAVLDTRLRWLAVLILGLMTLSTVVFHLAGGWRWLDSLYFAVTSMTTTGYGDISVLHTSDGLEIFTIALLLSGGAALAVLFTVLTDAIVRLRLDELRGDPPRKLSDHVIVCGLGTIGFRVVEQLRARGVETVAIESNGAGRFVAAARSRGHLLILADSRSEDALRRARIDTARAVVLATDDDSVNLEVALSARLLRPDIRVVVRLFDPELAQLVERNFDIHYSRSVSALAAPAFVAATLGQQIEGVATTADGPLVALTLDVTAADAPRVGSWAQMEARGTPVVAVDRDGEVSWAPDRLGAVRPGDRLHVLAEREMLTAVLGGAQPH
jgi:voltage-gated potassium channel Kch